MNFKFCVKNKSSILYILEMPQKLEKSTYEFYSHHSLKIFNSKRGVKILITSKIEITPNTMNKKSSNWAQNQKAQNIKKSQRVLQFIISRKKINKSIFNKKFWNRNWRWMPTKMWLVRVWMHSIQVIFFKNPRYLNHFLLILINNYFSTLWIDIIVICNTKAKNF